MHLTILGAGTAVPSPRRSPAGYLLRVGGEPLLFDAGPGTLARLAAAGLSYKELRRVFVSHLHSDHVLDLVTLLQASNATPGWTRAEPLELLGCRGLAALVRQVTAAFDGTAPEGFALQVTELGEERHDLGGWTLETAFTAHTPGSLAFRVEADNHAVVYSGDAIESDGLAQLARGADVIRVRMFLSPRLADGGPRHRRRGRPHGPEGGGPASRPVASLSTRSGS